MSDDAPTVLCEEQGRGDERRWIFRCPQCSSNRQSVVHSHPYGESGVVAAKCTNPASSYIATGYRLALAPGGLEALEGKR